MTDWLVTPTMDNSKFVALFHGQHDTDWHPADESSNFGPGWYLARDPRVARRHGDIIKVCFLRGQYLRLSTFPMDLVEELEEAAAPYPDFNPKFNEKTQILISALQVLHIDSLKNLFSVSYEASGLYVDLHGKDYWICYDESKIQLLMDLQ